MAKKIVIDPEDFDKLVWYVTTRVVRFNEAQQAVDITAIIRRVTLMDIEIKEKESQ